MSDELLKIIDLSGLLNLEELGASLDSRTHAEDTEDVKKSEKKARGKRSPLGLPLNVDEPLIGRSLFKSSGTERREDKAEQSPTQALEAPTAKDVMIEDLITEEEYHSAYTQAPEYGTKETESIKEAEDDSIISETVVGDMEFAINESGDLIEEDQIGRSLGNQEIEPEYTIEPSDSEIPEKEARAQIDVRSPTQGSKVAYTLSKLRANASSELKAPREEGTSHEDFGPQDDPVPEDRAKSGVRAESATEESPNVETSRIPDKTPPMGMVDKSGPVRPAPGRSAAGMALVAAAANRDLKKVRIMLASGVDIDSVDANGDTALLAAAYQGFYDLVELLIQRGADMEKASFYGNTPLLRAAYGGRVDIVRLLLENNANASVRNRYGNTALLEGCLGGVVEIVEALLAHGASIEERDLNGNTGLIVAVSASNNDIARLLISRGADVNNVNKSGDTPLIVAARSGAKDMVESLCRAGANTEAKDRSGNTALSVSARFGFTDLTKTLIDFGADPNTRNGKGHTPLMRTVSKGYPDLVKLLLERGGQIDLKDRAHGYTALMKVCFKGDRAMAGLLLQNGADPDIQDKNGNTALMIATKRNFPELAGDLLEYGANRELKNQAGRKAEDFANEPKIKEVLRK